MGLRNQTVTVYRAVGGQVTRQLLPDCFFRWGLRQTETPAGVRQDTPFLLIAPAEADILPGDRVLPGIGPEQVNWETFLPVTVPGLAQVAYTHRWPTHTEAGR